MTLMIDIDPQNPVPIYRQIVDQLTRRITVGALRPGDRVPTVREIAMQARVNRNTAARAIQELERAGLVVTRVGRGTFVSDEIEALTPEEVVARLDPSIDRLLDEARALDLDARRVAERVIERGKDTED